MESGPTADVPPRAATSAIEHALRASPVVVVLGARQTGKTTLVRSLPQLAQRPYLTLDDFDLRAQAAEDPKPSWTAIASAGQVVLSSPGSANLLMMEQIGETLAGRATYVTLWPFTRRERLGLGRTGAWSELVSAKFAKWSVSRRSIDS